MKRGKEKQGRKEPVSMKLNGPCGLNSCGCGSKLFTHLLSQKTSRHAQCLKISKKTRATSYVNTPVASIGITENGQKKVDRQVPFMHYSLAFRQVLSGKWTMFFGCPFLGAKTYPRLDRVFPFFLLTCCPDPDC